MSSTRTATVEAWLTQNTRTCPLGRMSEENCRRNRERPTIAEIAHGSANAPKKRWGGGNHLPRPHECDGCTLWQDQQHTTEGAPMQEIIVKEVKAKPNICADCGADFEPWKQGAAVITRVCKPCHNIRKTRGKALCAKQPVLRVDFTGHEELLEALTEAARREFRTPEGQVLAMVREINRSSVNTQ